MALMILSKLLLITVMIGVPALVGFIVGGAETTAWVTSVTAFAVYFFIGVLTKEE